MTAATIFLTIASVASSPTAIFATAACVALYVYGLNPITRWKLRHIPGPAPSWLAGNLPDFVAKGFHKSHFEFQRKYGPVMKIFFGRTPLVMVADPDYARKILLKNSDRKNPFTAAALSRTPDQKEFDEASLINSGAKKAKSLRGAWQPTFNPSTLAEYSSGMNKGASKLLMRLEAAAQEAKEVNIWRMFGDMTFDVVGSTAFGVDFNTQRIEMNDTEHDPSKDLVAASGEIFKSGGVGQGGILPLIGMMVPFLTPVVKPLLWALETLNIMPKSTKSLLNSINTVRTEAMSLAKAARVDAENTGSSGSKCPMAGVAGPAVGSFLHRIVAHKDSESGQPLSDPAVASQALLFMLAGYETTANTLAFSLYNLARFPDVQERVLAEVDAFGRDKEPMLADQTAGAFSYIEAVLNETLRMYPPATATAVRTLSEDHTLGDLVVPAESNVLVNILAMHYNEDLWPQPEEFKPERFLKDSPGYVAHHPYAHLPFGAGARQCIGMRFAVEEAIIALVRFHQKFTFKLSPGQIPLELGNGSTQGPKEGVFGTVCVRP